MIARLRLVAGALLSIAVFSFFVMHVRSQETSDIAMSTETFAPTGVTETTGVAQVADTAASTELIEGTAETTDTASTTETEETQPVINETALATSTPELGSLNLSINPELDTASSSPIASSSPVINGTSTEPTQPPNVEKEFILQPSVDLQTEGDIVSAEISFHNLSCRTCERQLKDTDVLVYYTAWYPNDGEIKEIGPRMGETPFSVSGLANWGEYKTDWSAKVPPGHYYFVVITDPDNLNNLYDIYRAEFAISP